MTYQLRLADGAYAILDESGRIVSRHTDRQSAFDAAIRRVADDHDWTPVPGKGFHDSEGNSVPFARFAPHVRRVT